MGDSRIRIQFCKAILPSFESSNKELLTVTQTLSADSTVRELIEDITTENTDLLSLLYENVASLWDCTTHPPKDISDWPTTLYCERSGTKSRTLYDCGWFPSGVLQVVPLGQLPILSDIAQYEDFQYNNRLLLPEKKATSLVTMTLPAQVQLLDGSNLLPSQLLQSVAQRFDQQQQQRYDDNKPAALKYVDAQEERWRNQQASKLKEQERCRKLEQRIQQLEKSKATKKKTVSEQVQRMLIKSRAKGRSNLDAQDCVYLRCLIVTDMDDDDVNSTVQEEYRYFSRLDTVGKILSSFDSPSCGKVLSSFDSRYTKELLVPSKEYCRIPSLLPLYEAMSRGYVSDFDKVVIRIYSSSTMNREGPTRSVEDIKDVNEEEILSTTDVNKAVSPKRTDEMPSTHSLHCHDVNDDVVIDEEIWERVRAALNLQQRKKQSVAVEKVRQMKIKSKAQGDAKRVKVEDRFYLELCILQDTTACQVVPVFASRSDSLDRLLRDHHRLLLAGTANSPLNVFKLVLLPSSNGHQGKFQSLSDDTRNMSLQEAEHHGILNSFDCLVLHTSSS